MTRNSIIFGGINSADFNVWISGSSAFSAPERDVEFVSVPGRNGDLLIDNGRWNNIQLTYPAFIPKGFDDLVDDFRTEIMKLRGYQKLEDTYHPDEYRMASFNYGLNPKNISAFLRSGEFDLTFNCKPQRFLKSGDEPIQLFPVAVSGNTFSSRYIPGAGSLHFEVHCPETDTLTVKIYHYNSSGDPQITRTFTMENGDAEDVIFSQYDKYFRVEVTGYSDIDATWLRIQTISEIDSNPVTIDAHLGRRFKIINPTGYATKPLIEVFGNALPYTNIFNSVDGVRIDDYGFRSNVVSDAERLYLDCDLQYLYDEDGNNASNKLIIYSSHDNRGRALVFPEFGTEEIDIQTYYSSYAFLDGLGLVQIYPRWWKL